MARRYDTTKNNISMHLKNILDEGKFEKDSVVKEFLTVQKEGIEILKDSGQVSHKQALQKAHTEYDKYMESHLTTAEQDYLDILNKTIEEINK